MILNDFCTHPLRSTISALTLYRPIPQSCQCGTRTVKRWAVTPTHFTPWADWSKNPESLIRCQTTMMNCPTQNKPNTRGPQLFFQRLNDSYVKTKNHRFNKKILFNKSTNLQLTIKIHRFIKKRFFSLASTFPLSAQVCVASEYHSGAD